MLNYSYLLRFYHYYYSLHTVRYFSSVFFRVNKFRIQYFRSLLCFAGPLSESEFLIVFGFSFPGIYL